MIKSLTYENVLEKHVEAVHEDVTLYCHYYNNDKDCPFEDGDYDGCIYLHEDSKPCLFGTGCERMLCMYKHKDKSDDTQKDSDESEDESDDEASDDSKESVKDLIPIIDKFREAIDKFDSLLQECNLKCKQCEFEAKDSNGLIMHMKAKHKNK